MLIEDDRVVLIRPVRLYREGMSHDQLYEITRKEWRTNPYRHNPDYAFAVIGGVVQAAFRIDGWKRCSRPGRWMFEGAGDDETERRYVGADVTEYFSPGAANPVRYVNC
jgi:hypothetical protein